MRTRRIAVGCRRTGPVSTVAIAPAAAGPAELQPGDLLREPPAGFFNDLGDAVAGGLPPYLVDAPSNRHLTLADLTGNARTDRHDADWDRNPGWPSGVGWGYIARAHSPRHARSRRAPWLPPLPLRAFTWTGTGVVLAVVMTVLLAVLGEA